MSDAIDELIEENTKCCWMNGICENLQCSNNAVWWLTDDEKGPDGYTELCDEHLLELLDTSLTNYVVYIPHGTKET